jgi:hypothetical protein
MRNFQRGVQLFPVMALAVLVLGGCGGRPQLPSHIEEAWKGHGPLDILRRYAGPDGRLTRAMMEAGLHKDFDAADLNHDGVLQPDEARAVNQQRWKEDQSAISPLQDWNGDGVIDFNEFAATARALFRDLDHDGNGVLTADELYLKPGADSGTQKNQPEDQQGGDQNGGQNGGQHRRGGRRGG